MGKSEATAPRLEEIGSRSSPKRRRPASPRATPWLKKDSDVDARIKEGGVISKNRGYQTPLCKSVDGVAGLWDAFTKQRENGVAPAR